MGRTSPHRTFLRLWNTKLLPFFNFTDVPRTVSHFVKAANRDDYVGKTLVRGVKYEAATGELVLSPKEKVMGVAFSLLWRPSRNHSGDVTFVRQNRKTRHSLSCLVPVIKQRLAISGIRH
jgi:hypothetical protein